MFSIFKKKYPTAPDFSGIRTDMHSHLLPGIDDGSPDPEQSLLLIRGLQDLGFSRLITTPHILSDMYPNNPETIAGAYHTLQQALQEAGNSIYIHAAAEYYIDDHFSSLITREAALMVLQDKHVLVEFPFVSAPYNYKEQLFQLQLNGYQPVLAHPERYSYYIYQKEVFDELKSIGCLFQVNLLSLAGYYGKQTQELAQYLIKMDYVNLLGTDLHNSRHLEALRLSGHIQPIISALLDSGQLINPEW